MKHTCFENSIPLDVCKEIKEFFDSHPELQVHKPNNPDVIKINSPWSHLPVSYTHLTLPTILLV